MTMTMNTLSASARSVPHAAGERTVSEHPHGGDDPEGQRGPVGCHGDPRTPWPPAPEGDRGAAEKREGEDGHRAASVVQLLELVEIDVAELES